MRVFLVVVCSLFLGRLYSLDNDLSHCYEAKYSTKTHIQNVKNRKMPLLVGMPNSGVVWMRDIIEQFTGKYTGSIGNLNGTQNLELQRLFPNGETCSINTATVACEYPFWVRIGYRGTVTFLHKDQELYCRNGRVYSFHYVLFMARNPYDSIVKGYQKLCQKQGRITDFESSDWPKFARQAASEYPKMWPHFEPILMELGSKLMIARYEHLTDPLKWESVINGLLVFQNRKPIDQDYIAESFRSISCIDRFPIKKLHDAIDLRPGMTKGLPFTDYGLVLELSQKLDMYLQHFGYDAMPVGNYSTSGNSWFENGGDEDDADLEAPSLGASETDSLQDGSSSVGGSAVSGVKDLLSTNSSLVGCMAQYHAVEFAPVSESTPAPPLLISLPGSGEVYVRKLIELVTGWFTGSLGTSEGGEEERLGKLFHGEKFCGRRFAAIHCPDATLVSVNPEKLSLSLHSKAHHVKCRRGGISEFPRSIVVVRNPYDAILSAYHEKMVTYHPALQGQILPMKEDWVQYAKDAAEAYALVWKQSFSSLLFSGRSKVLVVKYEDLLAVGSKHEILRNLSNFVGLFPVEEDLTLEQMNRVLCSYLVAPFSRDYDISTLQYSDIPYDSDLLQAISHGIEPYLTAFDYETLPNGAIFGKRARPSHGALPVEINSSAHSNLRGAVNYAIVSLTSSGRVLNMSYSKPLDMYDPPLILNGSVSALQATLRCSQNFAYRQFWTEPMDTPMLLSFAGSGNTWVRMLVEFATGIYSGSTDTSDAILKEEFVGENFCTATTSAIKAHPPQLLLADYATHLQARAHADGTAVPLVRLIHEHESSGETMASLNVTVTTPESVLIYPPQRQKCESDGMPSFSRYLFLVRDPYRAIFAEVNREITLSHIGAPTVEQFLQSNWYALLVEEARDYQLSWHNFVSALVNFPDAVMFAKYEKLTDPTERYQELYRIAQFVSANSPGAKLPSLEQLQCAFIQSDVANVHRQKNKDSMNATYLYSNQSLVDELWFYLRDFSTFAGYGKFTP